MAQYGETFIFVCLAKEHCSIPSLELDSPANRMLSDRASRRSKVLLDRRENVVRAHHLDTSVRIEPRIPSLLVICPARCRAVINFISSLYHCSSETPDCRVPRRVFSRELYSRYCKDDIVPLSSLDVVAVQNNHWDLLVSYRFIRATHTIYPSINKPLVRHELGVSPQATRASGYFFCSSEKQEKRFRSSCTDE